MYNIATAFPLPRSFDKEIVTEDSGFGSAAIMISPEAEKLRQQGNELYQSKNVPEGTTSSQYPNVAYTEI